MKISGVEIFSAGTWNDETYTVEDLNEMVRAFNENKVGARPHLKLGHDPKQAVAKKLLKTDGEPAVGWIEKLYVKGEKLVADFSDVHEKVMSAIQKRAYRKVSSEIFHNIKIGEKMYKKMLAAVALLGSDNPGVLNLEDIMSSYSNSEFDKLAVAELDLTAEIEKEKPMGKTENEIKLEFDLNQKDAELKEATSKLTAIEEAQKAKDDELAQLKEFKANAEKRELELLLQAEAAKIQKFTTELVAEKLCTPAMKPLVEQMLGEEKKEYTVKIDKDEKKLSKPELLKEVLKLYKAAAEVNFEETSEVGDDGNKDEETELDAKAKEYASKHKVSYGAALKAVMKKED